MDKITLKMYLGEIVVESEMSRASKLQMLEYIQTESDVHQLMALALDGQIVSLDEQSKLIVEDRFFANDIDVIIENHLSEIPGAAKLAKLAKVAKTVKAKKKLQFAKFIQKTKAAKAVKDLKKSKTSFKAAKEFKKGGQKVSAKQMRAAGRKELWKGTKKLAPGAAVVAGTGVGVLAIKRAQKRKECRAQFGNDSAKLKACYGK